jgi:predicted ATPase/class 3 adenylate cyclase
MPNLPSGTVTFLFTDIEGSTALWERDRQAMADAVERHLVLLRAAIEAHDGALFKVVGDAVQAAFPTAPDAVGAVLDGQRALHSQSWPESIGPVRVRMALHTAAATPQEGDYLAAGLNRLSRLLAAAHGGQVLLSLATQDLARDALPPGAGLRDLGEHPLRDLYRPERVFQLLHPELPADFPPIRTLATRPNNLPLQPTAFLGREEQVARVVDLLCRDGVRLLTITGPGGVGKTRLALQAAADRLEDFPDGVWFVDISSLTDPSLVPSAIAGVLGVRGEGSDVVDRLTSALGDQRVLLVLDNFERVLDATQVVSALLAKVPNLKVLATSRTPLHAYGEREYPLAPLPLPDPTQLPPIASLSQYEAVRLFIERAQAVKPDFVVTNANAPAVAEICSRLDGLPLAIELAAAFVKMLPPQALLKRLEKRLPLLTGGARTLPARQQTMRDAIAWSHDLLTADEQTLFRRLAVFSGGCTLEAAEAIVDPQGTLDVFGGIASLIDKSLLRQEEGVEGEPRFRMLETVREYGLERLEAAGDEAGSIRQGHAAYFAKLAINARADLSAGVPATVRCMQAEDANLRAMVTYLLESGDAEMVLRVAGGSLSEYWAAVGGDVRVVRDWLGRALQHGGGASAEARAWGLFGIWMVTSQQGDLAEAKRAVTEELELALALNHPLLTVKSRQHLSILAAREGRVEDAVALASEALRLARTLTDRDEPGWSLCVLASVQSLRGDVEAAKTALEEAVQSFQSVGGGWSQAEALTMLAEAVRSKGAYDQALHHHATALQLRRDFGQPGLAYINLVGLATIAGAIGYFEAAATLLGAEDSYRRFIGHTDQWSWVIPREQEQQALREQVGDARFNELWEAGKALSTEQAIAMALDLADEWADQAGGRIQHAR